MALGWVWWRAWSQKRGIDVAFCVTGVALGDIDVTPVHGKAAYIRGRVAPAANCPKQEHPAPVQRASPKKQHRLRAGLCQIKIKAM